MAIKIKVRRKEDQRTADDFIAAVRAASERGLSSREAARKLRVPLDRVFKLSKIAWAGGGLVSQWTKVSEPSVTAYQEARFWTLETAPMEVRAMFPKRFLPCENH